MNTDFNQLNKKLMGTPWVQVCYQVGGQISNQVCHQILLRVLEQTWAQVGQGVYNQGGTRL